MTKTTRSLLLLGIAPLLLGCASRSPQPAAFAPGLPVPQAVFTKDLRAGVACYRIPALIVAPDGTLVAAADERVDSCGDMDKNRDINIVMRASRDGGRTWSPIETVVDYPHGVTASDPSLIADRVTGALLLFYNYMDHDTAPGVYRLHVMRSDDAGRSWHAPRDITDQVIKPEWRAGFHFITSGNGAQTASGRLLHTLTTRRGAYVITSDDHGEHWALVDTPLQPGDESRIVELPDGTWMVNSRTSHTLGRRHTHLSRDQGNTWESRPEPALVDPGCNAGLTAFPQTAPDNAPPLLLFSNANAPRHRVNLSIRHSRDNGTTWSAAKTVYPGSAAYSVLAPLDEDTVGLLFEKDEYNEIVFVRLGLDWITAD